MRRYGLNAERLHDCSVRSYGFGECVAAAGSPCEYIFVVISGKAKVGITAPNGRDLNLCYYVSEGLIGEAELYSDTSSDTTTITALGELKCIAVPISSNAEYLNTSLEFTRAAAAELAKKLLRRADDVVENTLYTSEVRLCRYILAAASGSFFRDIMTDVARSIGVSYRHLYRMMGVLCSDGILEKTGSGYKILSMEKLSERGRQH